ncbi:hypothetical protein ACFOG5_17120 [Pedobacter fastidiosus]|uniref:Lipoprotein n=1 Tax=Pedobacter fastidiosus TaxID=2765361 RepID=A0ABR7KRI7_9SPHI|nr:hypothetical protein [Pedobacter fastidiosus]MBC6110691.1 hypothetical protein [Pedobacter fastidiosus]
MKKTIYIALFVPMFLACNRNPQHQFGDRKLSIQVREARAENPAVETAFQVRVFNLSKTEGNRGKKLSEKMEYGNDSSFYRIRSGQKRYASGVMPVSTGIRDCYEYLVFFPAESGEDNSSLVYRDRYISGRTYQLSLR